MPFVVPTFPVMANIWRAASDVAGDPDVVAPCNVAFGKRVTTSAGGGVFELDELAAYLLFPRGTDIRDNTMAGGADRVEVPVDSGRLYRAEYVNDLGTGFPNEHRFAVGVKLVPWPAPLPPVFEPAPEPGPVGG